MSKIYKGKRLQVPTKTPNGVKAIIHSASGVNVTVADGMSEEPLSIRRDIRTHSFEFNWGYGGSGPSQLALAICCDALGDEKGSQPKIYQAFKFKYVVGFKDEWDITQEEIENWYKSFISKEQNV